jgi:hypothetical protein
VKTTRPAAPRATALPTATEAAIRVLTANDGLRAGVCSSGSVVVVPVICPFRTPVVRVVAVVIIVLVVVPVILPATLFRVRAGRDDAHVAVLLVLPLVVTLAGVAAAVGLRLVPLGGGGGARRR